MDQRARPHSIGFDLNKVKVIVIDKRSKFSLCWQTDLDIQFEQDFFGLHIMLRDLLTQKCVQNFLVSDFGYPRACRIRKLQI
jgi:hypothetical protein